MSAASSRTVGFVGGGNMAEALIKGLLHAAVLAPSQIIASDVKADRLKHLQTVHGIRTTADNHALVRASNVVVTSEP